MNGKTSKLIRRWSKDSGEDPRTVKTLWKNTPHSERGKLSNMFKSDLNKSGTTPKTADAPNS